MQRRDILLDQINQLGSVLGKMLVDIFKLDSDGILGGLTVINEQFKSAMDLDFDELALLPKEELKQLLIGKNLTKEHLEMISDCLVGIATYNMKTNELDATQKLQKALEILEIADEHFQTISLSRNNKKQQIKNKLK